MFVTKPPAWTKRAKQEGTASTHLCFQWNSDSSSLALQARPSAPSQPSRRITSQQLSPPLAKPERSCHLKILCQTKQRGCERTVAQRQDQLGKSLKRVPPHEAASLSPSPRPGVLTAYGDEPWTCSKEYWRLYFGMECAELLSFNIRGLQKIPDHHRSYRPAGTGSRAPLLPGRAPTPEMGTCAHPRGHPTPCPQVWEP